MGSSAIGATLSHGALGWVVQGEDTIASNMHPHQGRGTSQGAKHRGAMAGGLWQG